MPHLERLNLPSALNILLISVHAACQALGVELRGGAEVGFRIGVICPSTRA